MINRFPYGDECGAWHVMHVMVPSGSSGRSFAILFEFPEQPGELVDGTTEAMRLSHGNQDGDSDGDQEENPPAQDNGRQ